LEDTQALTFLYDIRAPLKNGERKALTSLFEMLWGTQQPDVLVEDWEEYQRLCGPASPEFILNLPEYYGFFTYTLFRGQVSKNKILRR
jgi:demethylmenaquinone methyltransferase/2-methoxy-6-polyprenyl-1,4-benzoquinol methylase